MLLKHNDLTIRNAGETDAYKLASWWNDGSIMAHAGFPNGLGTTPQKIVQDIANDSDNTRRRLIIEKSGEPIGEMCYNNIGNNTAEIGIKICVSSQREKGYGKQLLCMLISHLFSSGYEKIVLDTNLKNTRAQHVYEQLGFKKLRVNADCWKNQLGELQSSVDYELTKEQFISFIKV